MLLALLLASAGTIAGRVLATPPSTGVSEPLLDAENSALPRCMGRPGVLAEERAVVTSLMRHPRVACMADRHDGLLILNLGREVLKYPPKQRQSLLDEFEKARQWRKQVGADSVLREGLAPKLLAVQVESLQYGSTTAGLPVYVESMEG